jgi:hypothetical protein
MKKTLKSRLTLNRETLRALDVEETANAQGGAVVQTTTGTISVVPSVINVCVSATCPTQCGQWYCYHV